MKSSFGKISQSLIVIAMTVTAAILFVNRAEALPAGNKDGYCGRCAGKPGQVKIICTVSAATICESTTCSMGTCSGVE
ncbi:MAG: hypothetical protein ACK47E_07230 [Cyclobacteriaceae bacterium]|jgi:hypothetical protein